eukprot:scaffold128434_cov34-Tisochrysis_lutea.AAC.3
MLDSITEPTKTSSSSQWRKSPASAESLTRISRSQGGDSSRGIPRAPPAAAAQILVMQAHRQMNRSRSSFGGAMRHIPPAPASSRLTTLHTRPLKPYRVSAAPLQKARTCVSTLRMGRKTHVVYTSRLYIRKPLIASRRSIPAWLSPDAKARMTTKQGRI